MVDAVPPQTCCVSMVSIFCHELHEKPRAGKSGPLLLGPWVSTFSAFVILQLHWDRENGSLKIDTLPALWPCDPFKT